MQSKNKIIFTIAMLFAWILASAQDYASLQKELDGSYYRLDSNDVLYFKYYGHYNKDTILFNIYNDLHLKVASNSLNPSVINSAVLESGHNEYSINGSSGSIFTSGYYTLELINEKKEKMYLRFKKE